MATTTSVPDTLSSARGPTTARRRGREAHARRASRPSMASSARASRRRRPRRVPGRSSWAPACASAEGVPAGGV